MDFSFIKHEKVNYLSNSKTFVRLSECLCDPLWLIFFYHKGARRTTQSNTKSYLRKSDKNNHLSG